jgi:hypothetical protein
MVPLILHIFFTFPENSEKMYRSCFFIFLLSVLVSVTSCKQKGNESTEHYLKANDLILSNDFAGR